MGELSDIRSMLETALSSITANLELHQQMIQELQKENKELRNKLSSNRKEDQLKDEVIRKFRRNKKRLIQNKILETIKYKHLSIPEIKEIIVDVHRYCSKATFYRYIEELRLNDHLYVTNNIVKIKPLVE
jgi:hypothetical protein